MKPLLLAAAFLLAATGGFAQSTGQATALSESLKKIAARFPRIEQRVQVLVGRRLNPQPLPASLPNPFYRGVEPSDLAQLDIANPVVEAVPAAPDITDADTLARIAPTLRITGLVSVNDVPHVAVNGLVCKAGDVIPIGGRDIPIFIQVRKVDGHNVTLGLNDAELTIQVKL